MKQFVVVSYDVPDDKRRTKIMKTLKGFGDHVQYSVFDCLLEPKDLAELHKRLAKLVKLQEDSIRFYYINQSDVGRIEVMGIGGVVEERIFIIH